MDKYSKTGGSPSSDTDSTNSQIPKLATSSDHRMLTPSEIELLLLKQIEIAERHRQFRGTTPPVAKPEAAE